MLVFLLASTLLHICSGQSLVTDLKISEHGADYEQRVEYDPSTKAVTYQVPKHHDKLASTVIIHKPTVRELFIPLQITGLVKHTREKG